jgi:hypothetical protein
MQGSWVRLIMAEIDSIAAIGMVSQFMEVLFFW